MTESPQTRKTLRLVWPEWQGAGADNAAALVPEVPPELARRSYAVGAAALATVVGTHHPTATVPVPMELNQAASTHGIESRTEIITSQSMAARVLAQADFERVLTLGGECAVSVAPFAELARRYGDDLAVLWVDSHPDVDTPETGYDGFHAMAVSTLLGHGDPEIVGALPATISSERFSYVGMHNGEPDALPNVKAWGLRNFGPEALRTSSAALLEWLRSTGASKVAIHLDVDVVDCTEVTLGLGAVPGGLTLAQVRRILTDVSGAFDVVGLTIAEFIPRSLLQLLTALDGLPLISD